MDAMPDLRPRREPILNLPAIVTASLAGLLLIHAVRVFVLTDEQDVRLLLALALVPGRFAAALGFVQADDVLGAVASSGITGAELAARTAFARFILAEPEAMSWTFGTYGLLHGSWTHVILNSLWLAAFGTPVARRCGAARFLAIAALATVGGGLLHVMIAPESVSPLIGASAGVSGLMAAAARFVFQPPGGGPGGQTFGHSPWMPVQTLPELLRNRPALLFLVVWFATNLLFGLAAVPLAITDASVAWDAHLGGFATGFLLLPLLDRRPKVPVI